MEDCKSLFGEMCERLAKFLKAYARLKKYKDILTAKKDSGRTLGEKSVWYGLVRFGRRSVLDLEKIGPLGEVKENNFCSI